MRLVAAVCLVGVLATAAPASARTTVYVHGRVVDARGAAVRGATVSFELHPDRTLYNQHDCPVRPWEIQCRVHKVAGRTDSAGRYRLPVRLSSFLATKRKHRLIVTDAPSAGVRLPAETEIELYFSGKSIDVPNLPLWRGRVSIDGTTPRHRDVHVDPMPATLGRVYSTGPVVTLQQGRDVVWTFGKVTEDRRVDNRVVEAGTTSVRATETRILGRQFPVYRSPAYAVADALRPRSRGASCATYGRGDELLPLPGCRFTDGKLAAPISLAYQQAGNKACNVVSQCANPRRLVVDMKDVGPVQALAVRGCAPGAAEVSAEGTVFAPWPTDDLGDGLLVGPPVLARAVRVDLSKCAFKATEVSVFGV